MFILKFHIVLIRTYLQSNDLKKQKTDTAILQTSGKLL